MTIEEKKAYLQQYRRLEARIDRMTAEKGRWMELATRVSPVMSGMPRAGGIGDRVLDAVQRIVDLEAELDAEIDRLVDLRREIEASIRSIQDECLQDILRRRYIDGERVEKIAVDLRLDFRWVQRLHAKALRKLTVESHP